ncbi:3-oxoacyl-[acyl-carrier-protein] reductase FabG-like [Aplysia californica]|uniref:3-oxoacyl-[acyl-carrier-protein] reductase FabG-like n=1 Tax=Aplysia californica TaxID=6500 RepID=A0ABM0K2J7_APLCA|nr:3-oxoacyl-[acyl-carrier-protein] reductase FabG-like [Aplysia californica]
MPDDYSRQFEGQVVIVTGASSGLGEEMALVFAERGAKVTLCGRNVERLEVSMAKCQKAAGGAKDRFITAIGDVNDSQVRKNIIESTVKAFGRLDVLVANAGMGLHTEGFMSESEESYDVVFNSNLKAPFFLVQEAIPELEKTKGKVVIISSIGSTTATGRFIVGAVAKAGLDHMTRCLSLALGPKNIRVNCVNPSIVYTRAYRYFDEKMGFDVMKKAMENQGPLHPLNGRCSTAREQANVVAFLASGDANFVTGQCVKVDGAVTLNRSTQPLKD